MKKILVLGAGMVAGPLVRYLLERDFRLTVTSLVQEDAVKLIGDDPRGTPLTLDLGDEEALGRLVADHDLVISLVPYSFHPLVANHCLQHGKHLITASYVSDEMAATPSFTIFNPLYFPGLCDADTTMPPEYPYRPTAK